MSARAVDWSPAPATVALGVVLGVVLVAAGGLWGCEGKGVTQPAGSDEAGVRAPEYRHATLDGGTLDLAALEGKVVLLNVWATWCEPCKEELPELARLHRELGPRGFTVVAVATDAERNAGRVRQMVDAYQLPFPVAHDAENAVMRSFEVVGFPTSILIGRDGTIRWRRDGMIERDDVQLGEQLELALTR